jgi:hypothetical protein
MVLFRGIGAAMPRPTLSVLETGDSACQAIIVPDKRLECARLYAAGDQKPPAYGIRAPDPHGNSIGWDYALTDALPTTTLES